MIRYLIFGFSHYYPGGGMSDLRHKTSERQEVEDFVNVWATEDKGKEYENLHVYDLKEGKLIYDARFDVHDYFDRDARDLVVKLNEL